MVDDDFSENFDVKLWENYNNEVKFYFFVIIRTLRLFLTKLFVVTIVSTNL